VFRRGYADLIGCTVAPIDLDPDRTGKQLWFSADEHDEAGPDEQLFLSYSEGQLREIWSGDDSVDIHASGAWSTEQGDCNEAKHIYTTTTTTMRWSGAAIESTKKISTEPTEPGDCEWDDADP
jgi:hypothetical protein